MPGVCKFSHQHVSREHKQLSSFVGSRQIAQEGEGILSRKKIYFAPSSFPVVKLKIKGQ